MGREIRKARYLSEISSVAELREARSELELREWFAKERLIDDVYHTFSFDNLLSMVAPPGSFLGRAVGGVGTGISVAQGVIGAIRSLIGERTAHRRMSSGKARNCVSGHTPGHTTKAVATRSTRAHAAKTSHPAARKRNEEIVVEVELEPARQTRPAAARTKKK